MKDEAAHHGKVTIADVARLAGVSKAVASRALSPERRPVSDEKRERVLAAASQLGFRVNLLAQSLTTKTVNLVAVVVNHIHDLSDLDLFDKLLAETQAIGKQVILIRVGSVDKVEEFYKRFYFRPRKIGAIVGEMVRDWDMMKRRLREGVEFFDFLRKRKAA